MSTQPLFPGAQTSCCHFLGTFEQHDLYYCAQGDLTPTVIARFGPEGPEYASGMGFSEPYTDVSGAQHVGIPTLVEARRRAEARGLSCVKGKPATPTLVMQVHQRDDTAACWNETPVCTVLRLTPEFRARVRHAVSAHTACKALCADIDYAAVWLTQDEVQFIRENNDETLQELDEDIEYEQRFARIPPIGIIVPQDDLTMRVFLDGVRFVSHDWMTQYIPLTEFL